MMLSEKKLWDEISSYRKETFESRLSGKFLSTDNVVKCIYLVEKIHDHLGIFKEILTEIKVDMIESIFSHKLTADERSEGSLVERIPYFELYRKSENDQLISNKNYQDTFDSLNERLKQQNDLLEVARLEYSNKENECENFQQQIENFLTIIEELNAEIKCIQETKEESDRSLKEEIDQLASENDVLKCELEAHAYLIKDLQFYKESHNHVDITFREACNDVKEFSKDNPVDPFNKKNNLESEVKAILTMQQDLTILENRLLEDFDRRLMSFKHTMLEYEENLKDVEGETSDANMGKLMMEFNKAKTHFKNECMQLEFESLMLENHQMVLINDLTAIHQTEMDSNQKREDDHKEITDSFIIDERLMSKYSAIIYVSSNDGETYYETKETVFCESCGGKVVFCPHNIIYNKVIKLPTGSTHIKIQRPEIKINSKFFKFLAPNSQYLREEKIESSKFNEDRKALSSRKSQRSSIASSESETPLPFEVLLEDYDNRTKISRISPRRFDEAKILSIFEDFWATILIEDEFDAQLSETSTICDKVYIFFLDRYVNERAAMLSLYDFLTSLIDAAGSSQFINLFCHILLVNTDSSVMRYFFHLLDCVDLINWSGEDDLRTFFETAYPFLNEDEVDSVVLSYISFSEHVYDKMKVFEFLLYNITRQRDPRFIMIKREASEFKTLLPGYYNFKEFQILLESLTSLPNKKLSIRLFKELALLYSEEGDREIAPLSKIAHIISFLSFLEIVDNVKQTLAEKYSVSSSLKTPPMRWAFTRLRLLSKQLQKDE